MRLVQIGDKVFDIMSDTKDILGRLNAIVPSDFDCLPLEDLCKLVVDAQDEITRLRKRCNPSKIIVIGEGTENDTAHYVSEAVHDEFVRLRHMVEGMQEHSHRCIKCFHRYTPEGSNEDCPKCGCDGTL